MIKLNKLELHTLYAAYCQLHKKWGVIVNLPYEENREEEKRNEAIKFNLPFYKDYWKNETDVVIDAIYYREVLFTSDTEEEMWNIYKQIRGRDGLPEDSRPGECYAYTISNKGIVLTENT